MVAIACYIIKVVALIDMSSFSIGQRWFNFESTFKVFCCRILHNESHSINFLSNIAESAVKILKEFDFISAIWILMLFILVIDSRSVAYFKVD